jgi:hypothetical protein
MLLQITTFAPPQAQIDCYVYLAANHNIRCKEIGNELTSATSMNVVQF